MKNTPYNYSIIIVLLLIFMQLPASGEYYQYNDHNGTVSFTDNPASIPSRVVNTRKIREDDDYDYDTTGTATRIKFIQNQILVPVKVNYRGTEQTATFLLDTGASTCTISPRLAKLLNIRAGDTGVGYAQGVGGSIHKVGRAELTHMTVGPNRKYNIEVSVIPTGDNDGLLGMNFLYGLRYHIDYKTLVIQWEN